MLNEESTQARVERCLRKFAAECGHEVLALGEKTDLARGLGLTSDEGLDLVLDLCEEFAFDFPHDFNPVVHDSGKRGRRMGELVREIEKMLTSKEVHHGSSR